MTPSPSDADIISGGSLASFQVKIPLCQVDLAQTINEWKDVQSCKEDDEYLGDICFSLRCILWQSISNYIHYILSNYLIE